MLIWTERYIEGEDLADQVTALKTAMVGDEEYKDYAIDGVQFLKKMTNLGYRTLAKAWSKTGKFLCSPKITFSCS